MVETNNMDLIIDKITETSKVLDLGCGYPERLISLYNEGVGFNYLGVDKKPLKHILITNDHQIDNLYWPDRFAYVQSEILEWLSNNKSLNNEYNVVILSHLLHFFNEEDKKVILNFCRKALKKNGTIYIKAHNQVINNSQPYYLNENDMALIKKLFNLVDAPIQHKYSIELIGIKK